MTVGILPNVSFISQKSDAKRGLSVCSRTTRLKNNQVRSRKRAIKTEKKSDDWGDSEPSELPKSVKYRGNPRRKVLGSIRRVRFTQSTLRQASIREKEGPSIEKIHVKIPHQRSPYAMKCEDRPQEETERQRAMRPRQGMESCQKYLQAQRKGQSRIPFAYR